MEHVEKQTLHIWNLGDIKSWFLYVLAIGVAYFFLHDYNLIEKACYIAWIFYTFRLGMDIFHNFLQFKNKRYEITEEYIRLTNDGWWKDEDVIPIQNVQHTNISQSTFSRFFNLYRLTIYTAGDTHTIAFIQKEKADTLKAYILKCLQDKENK